MESREGEENNMADMKQPVERSPHQAGRGAIDEFEMYRPLMFSIAYRMLGSVSEAEDTLQNAYLRYRQMPAGSIASPKAFLSTVVTRLCLNQLQTMRVQRES